MQPKSLRGAASAAERIGRTAMLVKPGTVNVASPRSPWSSIIPVVAAVAEYAFEVAGLLL